MEPGVALVNQVDSVLPADGWRPARRGENTGECRSDQDLARGFRDYLSSPLVLADCGCKLVNSLIRFRTERVSMST